MLPENCPLHAAIDINVTKTVRECPRIVIHVLLFIYFTDKYIIIHERK